MSSINQMDIRMRKKRSSQAMIMYSLQFDVLSR